MSRSYRRPYSAVCGTGSARIDKQMAARGVRRKQNAWLHNHWDEENFLLPHRLECHHNEVYDWSRDGHQYYHAPSAYDWKNHLEAQAYRDSTDRYGQWMWNRYGTWPPQWYQQLLRK